MTQRRTSRTLTRSLAAVAATSVLLVGCGDDGGDDDSTTTTVGALDSSSSTMAPATTGGAGNNTVPGADTGDTGGTDTTVSGAVPGQDRDQLDPPDDGSQNEESPAEDGGSGNSPG